MPVRSNSTDRNFRGSPGGTDSRHIPPRLLQFPAEILASPKVNSTRVWQPSIVPNSPRSSERVRSRKIFLRKQSPTYRHPPKYKTRTISLQPNLACRATSPRPVIRYLPSFQPRTAHHGHFCSRWPACSSTQTDARRQRYTWHQLWSGGREYI
jgi:hypothetical protein